MLVEAFPSFCTQFAFLDLLFKAFSHFHSWDSCRHKFENIVDHINAHEIKEPKGSHGKTKLHCSCGVYLLWSKLTHVN